MKPKTTNKGTPSAADANCSNFRVVMKWLVRSDMTTVLDIEQRAFEFAWCEEDFLTFLRQRNCIAMVAQTAAGQVIGYMVYELFKTHFVLLNLAVDPKFRRRGVGRVMIATMKGKLSVGHRCKLVINIRETNIAAQLFLKSEDFECVEVERHKYQEKYCDESGFRFEHDISGPKQKTLDLIDDFDWHEIADGEAIVIERV